MNELRPYLVVALFGVLLWAMRSAAGRLAPKVAIGSILFLVSRKAVLAAWAVGALGMLALILPDATARGHANTSDLLMIAGLSAFCGLGFAALLVGPTWMIVRAFARPPVLELEDGETILRELSANHFLGGEGRGGKLIVTTRRLAFRPHRFNVQVTTWNARLEDLGAMRSEGSRFLLVDVAGREKPEWFVVWNPDGMAGYLRALAARSEAERSRADAEAGAELSLPAPAAAADTIVPLP